MKINDDKLDEILAGQRKEFQMMCERFEEDINLKFSNILENGNEIIKTLSDVSADMKIILSDLQCIIEILKQTIATFGSSCRL